MARKNRYAPPGLTCHVVNRGNDRKVVFRHNADYVTFIELLAGAVRKFDVHVFGYCLMPNHFHLLAAPQQEDALSAFMQWLTGRYACMLRLRTETLGQGHVFQRRFWNAAVSDDEAFISVLRYIEANPVRAGRVPAADLWPWSSFIDRPNRARKILTPLPLELPARWDELVNVKQRDEVLDRIRTPLARVAGRPGRKSEMGQAHFPQDGGGCGGVADSYTISSSEDA